MATQLRASSKLQPYYGREVYYTARRIEYQFEWYEATEAWGQWSAGLVVYAVRPDGGIAWSGSTSIGPHDCVIDAVRAARETSNASSTDYGY